MKDSKPKKSFDNYIKYSNIAFQMAAIIGLGVFGGVKIDQYLGWKFPVFTLVLTLFSLSIAIYISIRDFLKKP